MAEDKESRTILVGFGDCQEVIKNFDTIKTIFEKSLAELGLVKEYALDTKNSTWGEIFSG